MVRFYVLRKNGTHFLYRTGLIFDIVIKFTCDINNDNIFAYVSFILKLKKTFLQKPFMLKIFEKHNNAFY